jgi:hypothetical protein
MREFERVESRGICCARPVRSASFSCVRSSLWTCKNSA